MAIISLLKEILLNKQKNAGNASVFCFSILVYNGCIKINFYSLNLYLIADKGGSGKKCFNSFTACIGFGALKTALPATNTSAPALINC